MENKPVIASAVPIQNYIARNDTTYIEKSKADNTQKAYKADWKCFTKWCDARNLTPFPATPDMVKDYIEDLAEGRIGPSHLPLEKRKKKTSTIMRRLSAIKEIHDVMYEELGMEEHKNPADAKRVKASLQGIKRELGIAKKGKAALNTDIAKLIYKELDDSLMSLRDKALIATGLTAGLRRSELCALNREDIDFHEKGASIYIRKSKTDQLGEGQYKAMFFEQRKKDLCPVRILQQWITQAKIGSGAVFRKFDRHGNILGRLSGDGVGYIIKRACEQAGFNPRDYAAHSLRSGFVTSAYAKGKNLHSIMRQTGHKSVDVARGYIRSKDIFEDNASEGLWE